MKGMQDISLFLTTVCESIIISKSGLIFFNSGHTKINSFFISLQVTADTVQVALLILADLTHVPGVQL